MIDIYVGEAKRHWSLHRNLLYHHSEVLEHELQGDEEKKPDRLDLPEYDPAGFELLVKWLYQVNLLLSKTTYESNFARENLMMFQILLPLTKSTNTQRAATNCIYFVSASTCHSSRTSPWTSTERD